MGKKAQGKNQIQGKPKKCDIADPLGTQKKACVKRKNNKGMYCKSCSLN